MKCQSCGSDRIAFIYAKCPDGFDVEIGNKGYESLPIENICDCEDVEPKICLNCGQCQGKYPVNIIETEDEEESLVSRQIWCETLSSLVERCKLHRCDNKRIVSLDEPYSLSIGFICENCNEWYCIEINDVKSSLAELDKCMQKSFDSRKGRELLASSFN